MMKLNRSIKVISIIIAFLFSNIAFSLEGSSEGDGRFVISYVDHESIINYYVPLLDAAYQSIGITPEFVLINDKSALKLLNSGKLDADTAKTSEVLGDYPDIIKVPTPISKIQVLLICQEELFCDLSLLYQAKKTLGVIGAKEFYAELLQENKSAIVEVNSFNVLLKLFKQRKVDFVFMVFDEYSKETKNSFKNSMVVQEKIGYHLLNKKHIKLLPRLDKAIQDVVARGGFVK